jgi:hypothetical protein
MISKISCKWLKHKFVLKLSVPSSGKIPGSAYDTSIYLLIYIYVGYGIPQSKYVRATSWTAGVRFSARESDFSLLHSIQTGSGARPASYTMGTKSLSSGPQTKNNCAGEGQQQFTALLRSQSVEVESRELVDSRQSVRT